MKVEFNFTVAGVRVEGVAEITSAAPLSTIQTNLTDFINQEPMPQFLEVEDEADGAFKQREPVWPETEGRVKPALRRKEHSGHTCSRCGAPNRQVSAQRTRGDEWCCVVCEQWAGEWLDILRQDNGYFEPTAAQAAHRKYSAQGGV